MSEIHLHFDDFIGDISYFNDLSLIKTIHFYIKNKHLIESKLSNIANLLFSIDDNNTTLYFQKKTIIGFMLASNNFYKFTELLNVFDKKKVKITDIPPPDKWTNKKTSESSSEIYNIVSKFVDDNDIDNPKIYKDYFCLNYRELSRLTEAITGINCDHKIPVIKGLSKKQKERLTKEQKEQIIKEQEEEQKILEEKLNTKLEKDIHEELIIKLSYFIYYYLQIREDKHLVNVIINHYVLHFFKSDRSDEYNIKMILNNRKKYSDKEMKLYNAFNNINEKNFEILPYLYQFEYITNNGAKKITKRFSTCGESTLLNILNYCLIKKNGKFNTSKILNEEVKHFYEDKKITDMTNVLKKKIIMTEWLDIVSNLGFPVYNKAGDIHNNVKNVASVFNKLVYDKDYSEHIDNPSQFIVDTILYLNNDINIEINMENTNDKQLYLNIDEYKLFFKPGHGEMYVETNVKIKNYIKKVDLKSKLSNKNEDSDFYIIYSIYAQSSEIVSGEKLDFDYALNRIMMRNPRTFIFNVNKNVIKVFLLTVNSFKNTKDILHDKDDIENFIYNIRNVKKLNIQIEEDKEYIVKQISSSYITSISKYCKELTELTININSEYIVPIDLSPLTELKNLSTLFFSGIEIEYMKPLENLNLNELSLQNYDTSIPLDFNFIKGFINLEKLDLLYIHDLNPIKDLTNLNFLRIYQISEFDVKLIKKLSLLRKILVYNSRILNAESFKYLTNLKDIVIIESDFSSTSIEPIVNMDLEKLMLLRNTGIKSPVKIYNKNINPEIIKHLEKINIEYVLQSSSKSSRRSSKSSKRSPKSSRRSSKSSKRSPKSSSRSSKSSPKSKRSSKSSPKLSTRSN